MRVLVTAASRHGAIHEIAAALADGLQRRGVDADFGAAEELPALDGYDAFVIGSAVYVGRWLDPAKELVADNARRLADAPVWLFSSGPARAARGPQARGRPR
jgi:menaquinone-dependent protoporphyrinogen oxidase